MKKLLAALLLLSACSPDVGTSERGLLTGTLPAILGYDNGVKFIERSGGLLWPWEKLDLIDTAEKSITLNFDEKLRVSQEAPVISCKVSYHVRDSKDDLLSFRMAFSSHAALKVFLQSVLQDKLLKVADLEEILFSNTEPLHTALAEDVSQYGVELTELSISEYFDEKAINAEKQTITELERKVSVLREALSQKQELLTIEQATQVTALQNDLVSAKTQAELIIKKADSDFEAKKKAADATLETGRLKLKELEEVANLLQPQEQQKEG